MDNISEHRFRFDILPRTLNFYVNSKRSYSKDKGIVVTITATTRGGISVPASSLSWPYSRGLAKNFTYLPEVNQTEQTVLPMLTSRYDLESVTIEAQPWNDKKVDANDIVSSIEVDYNYSTLAIGASNNAKPLINVLTIESKR